MKRTAQSVGFVLVFVLVIASSAFSQTRTSTTEPADEGHSMWRNVLLGFGVGAGAGLGVGWMRSDFHRAECATLSCDHTLEAKTLAPIGAAAGAAIGVLLYRSGHGGPAKASRPSAIIVTPSYGATRKSILLRALF
jgi:hypothetical protein